VIGDLNRAPIDSIVNTNLDHVIPDGETRHFHAQVLRTQTADQATARGADFYRLNGARLRDGRDGVTGLVAFHGPDTFMVDENLQRTRFLVVVPARPDLQ
jgi:hypothetical protein